VAGGLSFPARCEINTITTGSDVQADKKLNLKAEFTAPSFEDWKKVAEADLKGAPYDKKLITKTYEGIDLQPIYTAEDIQDLPAARELPGAGLQSRGSQAQGPVVTPWKICQDIPAGLAEDFNEILKRDLYRGQTAISVVLDRATRRGVDADFAKPGEVGIGGLSVSGTQSLSRAFSGIALDAYPVFVKAGYSGLPFLALLIASLKKDGRSAAGLTGSVEADPLGYLAAEGQLPVSLNQIYNEMKTATNWVRIHKINLKTIGIDTTVYQEAGATAVQELAAAMATLVTYLEELTERGVSPSDIAPCIRFTFGIGTHYFMEIAKFRAARVLWTQILTAYGLDPADYPMSIHAKTSSMTQTDFDPYVNLLRTTTEAFSAAVGGVGSLHTHAFDESWSVPDEFSRRIARNTQIILAEESHLSSLIDPAGGSYFIEKLTADLAGASWELFKQIQEKGGMTAVLQTGYLAEEVRKAADARRADIAKRKSVIVGVNAYANIREELPKPAVPDAEAIFSKRAEYLQKYRVSGGQEKHIRILETLEKAGAEKSEKQVDLAIEAALEGATLGELTQVLRSGKEDGPTVPAFKPFSVAADFSGLRKKALNYKAQKGHLPQVFLANMGPLAQYKGRSDFSRGFFETGGFEVVSPAGFETAELAAKGALESKAPVVVICSTDETYPELVPVIVKGIKSGNPGVVVVLAGYPKEQIEAHKAAGVDEFIFLGADVVKTLTGIWSKF